MSLVLVACVAAAVDPIVALLVEVESLCASVETSTNVVPTAPVNSLGVLEVDSVSFSLVGWLVIVEPWKEPVAFGRNILGPALVLGRWTRWCCRRFSSMKG